MASVKRSVHEIDFAQTPVEDLDRSIAKTSISLAYFILELTTLSDLDAFRYSGMLKHEEVVENIGYMRKCFKKYYDPKTEEVMKVLTEHVYEILESNIERGKAMNVAVGKTINHLLATSKQSIVKKGMYPDEEELIMVSGLAEAFAVSSCIIGTTVPICFDAAKLKLLLDIIYASDQSDFLYCTTFSASMRSMDVIMKISKYDSDKIREVKAEAAKMAKGLFPDTSNFDELLQRTNKCVVAVRGSVDDFKKDIKSSEIPDQSKLFDDLNIVNGSFTAEC